MRRISTAILLCLTAVPAGAATAQQQVNTMLSQFSATLQQQPTADAGAETWAKNAQTAAANTMSSTYGQAAAPDSTGTASTAGITGASGSSAETYAQALAGLGGYQIQTGRANTSAYPAWGYAKVSGGQLYTRVVSAKPGGCCGISADSGWVLGAFAENWEGATASSTIIGTNAGVTAIYQGATARAVW